MVNFKQMIGLIILSIGIILMIYALRSDQGEASSNGTLIAGTTLVISGIALSLYMNKQR